MAGGGMWMMMAFCLVGALLVLTAVAALAYALARGVLSAKRSQGEDAAMTELRVTFARGAITSDEYVQRRDLLERERR